jgi:predicted RNase H-like HicB family nuclease
MNHLPGGGWGICAPALPEVLTEQAELTTSEESLVAKMEEIIQLFLDLLQVTGGNLAPEKYVWYLISHRWNDGKPKLLQKHSSHPGIKIVSRSTNTESIVKRKAPNEGHRTLGFFTTGDGTCSAHKKVTTEKSIAVRHCY